MSDRRPPAFSLVAALADRLFTDAGIHGDRRRRDRGEVFTPSFAAGPSGDGASSATGRGP